MKLLAHLTGDYMTDYSRNIFHAKASAFSRTIPAINTYHVPALALIHSLTLLQSSTGCVYHNGSTTKLRSWPFEHWMVCLRHT